MNNVYTATCGADVVGRDEDLFALLDWLGPIHESGESIAVWQGAVLVLVIDGGGHTTYLTDPEGQP
jgi:hypothetical protein